MTYEVQVGEGGTVLADWLRSRFYDLGNVSVCTSPSLIPQGPLLADKVTSMNSLRRRSLESSHARRILGPRVVDRSTDRDLYVCRSWSAQSHFRSIALESVESPGQEDEFQIDWHYYDLTCLHTFRFCIYCLSLSLSIAVLCILSLYPEVDSVYENTGSAKHERAKPAAGQGCAADPARLNFG